jgi:hypothetical protein
MFIETEIYETKPIFKNAIALIETQNDIDKKLFRISIEFEFLFVILVYSL